MVALALALSDCRPCASHTVTVGYLLCWRVVLALLEAAGDELRPKYTEYLKTRGLLDSLFGHLFRLLPKTAASDKEMFLTELSVTSTSSAAEIQQMAGSTWVSVCRHLPAVARSWWQSLDKVGREAREAAAKKGGEVVRGEAEPVLEVLTMAARSAGL